MLANRQVTNYVRYVFRSKGFIGFFLRAGMLVRRFDLSGNKMKKAVSDIEQFGRKYKYKPALIIPSIVLRRHHRFFDVMTKESLEFCAHGYTHRDFKPLSLDEQVTQIRMARDVFNNFDLPVYGFRSPYLSRNSFTTEAIGKNDFLWESNETMIWKGYLKSQEINSKRLMRDCVHLLYNPHDARKSAAIPRLRGDVVCIPVTLPDDEILVDRLGIEDSKIIEDVWMAMLDKTKRRGEIFVLQLHPERFEVCKDAMQSLLSKASDPEQGIWVTSMKEVAEWWKERSRFKFRFESERRKGFRVHCQCTDRAIVLCRDRHTRISNGSVCRGYRTIADRDFFVESGKTKPCIGVPPDCPKTLLDFLRDEAFFWEVSNNGSEYSLFLGEYDTFCREDEKTLLAKIERNPDPIIRYWRWPKGMRSAFVTSHDLDCLTLTDFLFRSLGK